MKRTYHAACFCNIVIYVEFVVETVLDSAFAGTFGFGGHFMLKIGDTVYINGTHDEGIVKEIHPHEALVRVKVSGGHEDRKYALETLRRDPTMSEATDFIDH